MPGRPSYTLLKIGCTASQGILISLGTEIPDKI
jgi:hypothetical protein